MIRTYIVWRFSCFVVVAVVHILIVCRAPLKGCWMWSGRA